ncbi:MAG: hypothetical protein HYS12_03860 [Planctomycetes bacterium]|nr:hypothetical protein [Planctomycetota bacterium]
MRYFTPDLFVRLQNCRDQQVFLDANQAWERAVESYGAQLEEIRPDMPEGLRQLTDLGSLHDASVLSAWQGRTRLTVVLHPELEASRLVVLTYHLVDPPYIDRTAIPDEYRSSHTLWLYDEIGLERETVFDVTARVQFRSEDPAATGSRRESRARVFTHDILLSNGWEMRLRFHYLEVSRPTGLIPPAPGNPSPSTSTLPQSA